MLSGQEERTERPHVIRPAGRGVGLVFEHAALEVLDGLGRTVGVLFGKLIGQGQAEQGGAVRGLPVVAKPPARVWPVSAK